MTHTNMFHGGLVFFDDNAQELDGYCRIVASTLQDYGHSVDRQSLLSQDEARITTPAFAVRLQIGPANRLILTLLRARSDDDPSEAQLMLLVMLYRMIEAYGAQDVEWLDPQTVLPAPAFMSAFAQVSPRRVRSRQEIMDGDDPRFASVDDTEHDIAYRYDEIQGQAAYAGEGLVDLSAEQALSMAFRETPHPNELNGDDGPEQAQNDIRRLASWGMTGVVVCISGPVGLSMAAVNLAKGEDFRLNTHVLSLTGFLGVMTSGTAMADVLSVLPI